MRGKLRLTIVFAILAVTAAVCFGLRKQRLQPQALSLIFQRYSNFDAYMADGEIAFLWLTNASKKSYLLTMTGNTNTLVLDSTFNGLGQFKQSWMVNCEFSDVTPYGRTSWTQMPSPFMRSNAYLSLAPHSGMTVRVPVPPSDQHRRVAVLCQMQEPFNPGPSWASKPGFLARLYWRQRVLLDKLASPKSHVLRVWCDRDLSRPNNLNAGQQ